MKCLNKVLKKNGKKQKDLAIHLNVSAATISRFCSGEMSMSINQILETSAFLDVLLIDLIDMIRIELQLPVKDDPYCRVKASVLDDEYEKYISKFSERLLQNHQKACDPFKKSKDELVVVSIDKVADKLSNETVR